MIKNKVKTSDLNISYRSAASSVIYRADSGMNKNKSNECGRKEKVEYIKKSNQMLTASWQVANLSATTCLG